MGGRTDGELRKLQWILDSEEGRTDAYITAASGVTPYAYLQQSCLKEVSPFETHPQQSLMALCLSPSPAALATPAVSPPPQLPRSPTVHHAECLRAQMASTGGTCSEAQCGCSLSFALGLPPLRALPLPAPVNASIHRYCHLRLPLFPPHAASAAHKQCAELWCGLPGPAVQGYMDDDMRVTRRSLRAALKKGRGMLQYP